MNTEMKLAALDERNKPLKISRPKNKMIVQGATAERLTRTTGTTDSDLSTEMLLQATRLLPETLWEDEQSLNAIVARLHDIHPRDTLEAMLASQMIAVNNMLLELAKRIFGKNQTVKSADSLINNFNKLTRTFTLQMEALRKYRTDGKQTIQVQHVNVNDGGQAIVGNIKGGGNE